MDSSSDSASSRNLLLGRAARVQVQARVIRTRSAEVRRRIVHRDQALPRLSPREHDVLALVSTGVTTKSLAIQLGISANTAGYHLSNIYRKLGTHNRVEAVNEYFRRRAGA